MALIKTKINKNGVYRNWKNINNLVTIRDTELLDPYLEIPGLRHIF